MWCHDPVTSGSTHGGQRAGPEDGPAAYGDRLGRRYDTLYPPEGLETDPTVDFLTELAESRPSRSVLEFGVGTGRLALELHRRGILVAGIEASVSMVAAMRSKAPNTPIEITVGDFASARVPRAFSVVALVFNTILDERGLSAQLAVFENAARHLEPGGCFVVEALVLDDEARDGDWTITPRYVGADHVELQLSRFDIETSTLERTLVHLRPEGPQFVSVRDAYASPGQLDVMAHVKGMTRIARYSSWTRDPFTSRSRRHISVYQLRPSSGRASECG